MKMGLYDRDYMRDSAASRSMPRILVTISILVSLIAATSYLMKELRLFSKTSPKPNVHTPSRHEKLLAISPLDLNTATYEELRLLPHVTESMATDIMAARPLRAIEQLDDVYGIGEKKLAAIRPHVYIDTKTIEERFPDPHATESHQQPGTNSSGKNAG